MQFLKVVPVRKDGLEAKFADAPIVPVAIPEGRRPALPLLDGDVDAETGRIKLVVTSDGFNRKRLMAEESGLFAATPSGQPPEFRIRRAFGDVADPIYARVVHSGPMKVVDRDTDIPVFAGRGSRHPGKRHFPEVRRGLLDGSVFPIARVIDEKIVNYIF